VYLVYEYVYGLGSAKASGAGLVKTFLDVAHSSLVSGSSGNRRCCCCCCCCRCLCVVVVSDTCLLSREVCAFSPPPRAFSFDCFLVDFERL